MESRSAIDCEFDLDGHSLECAAMACASNVLDERAIRIRIHRHSEVDCVERRDVRRSTKATDDVDASLLASLQIADRIDVDSSQTCGLHRD